MKSIVAALLLSIAASSTAVAAVAAEAVPPAPDAHETPESPKAEQQALFDQATADYQAKRCDVAMPAFKMLVSTGFHSMESALALRDCYLATYKAPDAVVAQLQKEIAANPDDEVAHSNLGCFYLLQQKRDEAQTELNTALRLNPNDLDARCNLAFWYASVGQGHTAIKEYDNILKADPANRRALTEQCNLIAEQENDAKRAEPYCARAAAGQEGNEMIGVTLGLVRMRQGDYDGAEKAFGAVLAANPEARTAQTFFGVSRLQRGDYDGAQKAFETLLAKAPEETDARVGLARTFQARKEFGKAANEYRTAYHQTGNGMLLGALVKAYLQQYFLGIIALLLAAMAFLLWRYLNVKSPEAPEPPKTAAAH
jgi:Tfp pilus assembly protein PilF